jgi:serine/threonine-protein kinase
MGANDDGDDPRLAELLLRWEELHDQGRSVTPQELCSTCPELADELGRRIALLRQIDPLLDDPTTSVAPPRDRSAPGASRRSATARAEFLDLRFHAAGALGEVFMARNAELNREVALKFIKPERGRDPVSLRRFLQEAEVTSRLEHPGVVPIYALGTDSHGAPCYAMRFIRGTTLQDAIDAFHAAEKPGRDPSERSLALRDLLNRFVSICSTMAYAHSRGILHRDLKPRNVMLGKYDETLVVDWGLAKPFNRDEAARLLGEESLRPSSGSDDGGSDTPTVGMVGTPAYMSPEQAEARLDLTDPASDIFSLGGILYAILTGEAPYQGRKLAAVLEKVKRCEFSAPRQVKPGVPRALEAICLKAMAERPEDRYATAADLAADVRRWLADEPVTAYPEPLRVRARRWMQRHKPLVAAAVAMLITAVAVLTASTVVISRKQAETDAARLLAASNFQKARDAVERMLSRAGGDRLDRSLDDVEQVRRDLLEDALEFQQEFLRQRPTDSQVRHDVARARLRAARIRFWLGKPREAEADCRKAIAELEQLAAEFPAEPSHRIELANGYYDLSFLHGSDGHLEDSEAASRRALDLQRVVARDDPAGRLDLARYLNNLATVFIGTGRAEDLARAEELLREAEGVNSQLVAETPREPKPRQELVAVLANRSRLRKNAGDLSDAEAICRRALDVQVGLVNDDPGKPIHARLLAKLHNSLGSILQTGGRRDDAEREYRSGLKILEKLAADFPTAPAYRFDLSSMLVNLARVVAMVPSRAAETQDLLRRGLGHLTRLVDNYPGDLDYRNALIQNYNNMGEDLSRREHWKDAEQAFRNAEMVLMATQEEARKTYDYRANLGMIQHNVAEALKAQKRLEEALVYYDKAIENQRAALDANPGAAFSRQALSNGYWAIADAQLELGRTRDAAAAAEMMLPLFPSRWEEPFYAAELLSRCSGQARTDAGQSQTYAYRAVALLRMAVDRGYKDAAALRTDPALAPVRDRDDFRRLLTEVFDRGFPADPFAR